MSRARFFVGAALEPGQGGPGTEASPVHVPLAPEDLHHALRVLRVQPGEEIEVAGPDRRVYRVVLTAVGPEGLTGAILGVVPPPFEPRVTLVQGLAKADKLDLVVEKAVEVGVEAIVPVVFQRSVVKLDAGRARTRTERLRRVAGAAAKQAARSFVPLVSEPVAAADLLRVLEDADHTLVAWEAAAGRAPGIVEALAAAGARSTSSVAIIVGPEGGLTSAEVEALVASGAVNVSLGETVLRTETAGILSAALCVYALGGLGGRSRG